MWYFSLRFLCVHCAAPSALFSSILTGQDATKLRESSKHETRASASRVKLHDQDWEFAASANKDLIILLTSQEQIHQLFINPAAQKTDMQL